MYDEQALAAELEEERWLRQDTLEAAVLDQGPPRSSSGRFYKVFSAVAAAYLFVNVFSVRTPGPAHWLGIASHVHLIGHIQSLL
jgi:hypothetical protein